MTIVLTKFAHERHFGPKARTNKVYGGTSAVLFDLHRSLLNGEAIVVPGYADFCQLVFIPNETSTLNPVVEVTEANSHLLRASYTTRSSGSNEVPYLERHFPSGSVPQERAKWLGFVLYSGKHLREVEGDLLDFMDIPIQDYDQGIVAIMGLAEPKETPMSPMTMVRNALGPEFGGSGVALDREAYLRSVEFWDRHALVS